MNGEPAAGPNHAPTDEEIHDLMDRIRQRVHERQMAQLASPPPDGQRVIEDADLGLEAQAEFNEQMVRVIERTADELGRAQEGMARIEQRLEANEQSGSESSVIDERLRAVAARIETLEDEIRTVSSELTHQRAVITQLEHGVVTLTDEVARRLGAMEEQLQRAAASGLPVPAGDIDAARLVEAGLADVEYRFRVQSKGRNHEAIASEHPPEP